MLDIKEYRRVSSLEEAYELNQKKNAVILGGMHWLKMMEKTVGTAIDLSALGLDEIVETEDCFEIGCMVSLRQLEKHDGLHRYTMGAMAEAVKDIVGVQFRNTATVGGSIFGRYGFSDVLTLFLALDTTVVCYHAGEIPLAEYAKLPADRDILVKLIVKKVPIRIAYRAMRHAKTDFPLLACAVSHWNGSWRAVLGARPGRGEIVPDTDGILAGEITEEKAEAFGRVAAEQLVYGSNLRGSAEYRRQITPVLVKRAVLAAGKER